MTDIAPRKRGFRPKTPEMTKTVQPTRPDILPPARRRQRVASPPADSAKAGRPDYDVGYKKPPRHSQFKPGQSGNPKGRSKGAKGMKTLVRENLTARVKVRTAKGTRSVPHAEALLLKLMEMAQRGNLRAALTLLGWYSDAVPDAADTDAALSDTPITKTDEAILDELREFLLTDLGDAK